MADTPPRDVTHLLQTSTTARPIGRRRRATVRSRLRRAARHRGGADAPRARRAHAAADGAGARGLPAAGRPDAGRLAEPRPLLRHRGARDAADPGRPRAQARRRQARRRLAARDPRRRAAERGRRRSSSRSRSSPCTRRSSSSPGTTRAWPRWSSCASSPACTRARPPTCSASPSAPSTRTGAWRAWCSAAPWRRTRAHERGTASPACAASCWRRPSCRRPRARPTSTRPAATTRLLRAEAEQLLAHDHGSPHPRCARRVSAATRGRGRRGVPGAARRRAPAADRPLPHPRGPRRGRHGRGVPRRAGGADPARGRAQAGALGLRLAARWWPASRPSGRCWRAWTTRTSRGSSTRVRTTRPGRGRSSLVRHGTGARRCRSPTTATRHDLPTRRPPRPDARRSAAPSSTPTRRA